MSVPKHWLLGRWYPRGLTAHQQWDRSSDRNKNVDIKGKNVWEQYNEGLKQESQNLIRSLMPEGGEP